MIRNDDKCLPSITLNEIMEPNATRRFIAANNSKP